MQIAPETRDRGESLRKRRRAVGLTQARLAGYADCGVTTIENIEAGSRPKNSPTLARLYAVLDGLEEAQAQEDA